MLPESQRKHFEAFYESTVQSDLLDAKTTVIAQLATSFAIGCYP